MNLYFGKKAKEKAYLESIENNGIFENNFKSAFGQTKIAELVRNHLNSSGSKIKKALIYGFDGARADSMIYLIPSKNKEVTGYNFKTQFSAVTQLKNQGGLYLSYAGGDLKNPETLQETSTAQGWASVLTGQWGIENGVVKHVTKKDSSPTVLMEAAQKGLSSVFAAIWPDHFDITYKSEIQTAEKNNLPLKFIQVKDENELQSTVFNSVDEGADVIFAINEFADYNGHSNGFGHSNYRYVMGVTNADRYAYKILKYIESKPAFKDEDWLFIITSDHGGHQKSHGTQLIEDRLTFIASNKKIEF